MSAFTQTSLKTLSIIQYIRLVWRILFLLNRQAELLRLIDWASRRKFRNPWNAYRRQHGELSFKLLAIRSRCPGHYRWAYLLHLVSKLTSKKPHYYKGSASHYRRSRKTR